MNIVDIIIKKRDRQKLTKEEIDYFVQGVVDETIADYQVSALLMAMYLNHLDEEETSYLTLAMAHSGKTFDLNSLKGIKVDKHSTGGVADTTTLVLCPLVASLGACVVKMSGRGLGFSGGTLDKLSSIPGFQVDVSEEDAVRFASKSNIVLMSQTNALTPADKKLYALRDVTGTVESMPLIASSIMSKKIAAGADAIVLDVKCGSGAFMKDYASAKALAEEMVSIGKQVGRRTCAVISSMEQPLGQNIGNSLEVIEAIEVLKANAGGDLLELSLTLGARMLMYANKAQSIEQAKAMLMENIQNGKGLMKLEELIRQQHGNPDIINDYSLLPKAAVSYTVTSPQSGYISHMDTSLIGRASLETGAGRVRKTDTIDYAAGIVMRCRIGDKVKKGDPLAIIYANSQIRCESAAHFLSSAIFFSQEIPKSKPLILDMIE